MKTRHYPIVLERESNGSVSAYVIGVPGVYAAGDTMRQAEAGVRKALSAHLDLLQEAGEMLPDARAELRVATVKMPEARRPHVLRVVGVGAWLGRRTTPAKAAASRANGRKGGRPRLRA